MKDLRSALTIPDIVRTYPVSDSAIRRAILEERLPAEKILGKYRIAPEDVERFLRAGSPR